MIVDTGIVKLDEFVRVAPKIENHVHLDGSYDHGILYRVAKQYVDELPEEATVPVLNRKIPVRKLVQQ